MRQTSVCRPGDRQAKRFLVQKNDVPGVLISDAPNLRLKVGMGVKPGPDIAVGRIGCFRASVGRV